MTTTRRLALGATAFAVALAASTGTVAGRAPMQPDDEPAPPVTVAPALDPDGSTEVVHSWALAPAGSSDPGEAGNRPNLSYSVDPGGVVEDAVTLYNFGNEQLTFRVYATDAFNNDTGEFDILPGDEVPTDVGSWLTIPQEFVQVPPGQQVTMPITLTVPEDADPGDHAGAIVAASEARSTGEGGDVVSVERRTGTRVYVRVGGPLRPELTVEDVSSSYSHALNPLAGAVRVEYRIVNTGNVRLAGESTVRVSGPFGVAEQSSTAAFPELLPGEDITVSPEDFDGVPALGLVSADVDVTTDATGGVGAVSASAGSPAFAPPLTLLLGLVAFLFALIGLRSLRRHRHGGHTTDVGGAVTDEHLDHEREPQPT